MAEIEEASDSSGELEPTSLEDHTHPDCAADESTSLEDHTHLNCEAEDADSSSQEVLRGEKTAKKMELHGNLWHMIRLVVDSADVGRVVGKNGRYIHMIRGETNARVRILDEVPETWQSTIMVTSEVTSDAAVPPAVDAIMRIHRHLIGGGRSGFSSSPVTAEETIATNLLIPANQIGYLIGQKGEAINTIRRQSGTKVRTFPLSSDLHAKDRIVEIVGTANRVHKALQLIVTHMLKLPVARNVVVKLEAKGRRATATTVYRSRAKSPPRWQRGRKNAGTAPRHRREAKNQTVRDEQFDEGQDGSKEGTADIDGVGSDASLTQTDTVSPVLGFSSYPSYSPPSIHQSPIVQQVQDQNSKFLESSNVDPAVIGMSFYPGACTCHYCTKVATHDQVPSTPNENYAPQFQAAQSTGQSFNFGVQDVSPTPAPHRFDLDPSHGFIDLAGMDPSMMIYQLPVQSFQNHAAAAPGRQGSPPWILGPMDGYHFASSNPNYVHPSAANGTSYGYRAFSPVSYPWIPSYTLVGSYGGY
ncbi:hypothetical protein R1flu_026422 [Riccia fluitans]|uniref:K Homology domain-containing protein n=1 Tax=Riccia fluitans TaxID=41844 RepID=A0ABD1XFX2_9MARC